MRVQWSELGAAAVLVGGACALIYAGVQRSLRRAVAEREQATERQIAALVTTVKALQTRVTELSRIAGERAEETPAESEGENAAGQAQSAMRPELLAVISAAATAYAGKSARIRSAKLVPADEPASAWTQQGRMIVQTSHNLRARD